MLSFIGNRTRIISFNLTLMCAELYARPSIGEGFHVQMPPAGMYWMSDT